jgi:hypothetical protein
LNDSKVHLLATGLKKERNYRIIGFVENKENKAGSFVATKWLNLNNPVRSAGETWPTQKSPERVQYYIVEPFQGSGLVGLISSGLHRRLFKFKPVGFKNE